jgi:hypothetical protein
MYPTQRLAKNPYKGLVGWFMDSFNALELEKVQQYPKAFIFLP